MWHPHHLVQSNDNSHWRHYGRLPRSAYTQNAEVYFDSLLPHSCHLFDQMVTESRQLVDYSQGNLRRLVRV